MKIAIVGLGKMGGQIIQKLLADSHEVIGFDQNAEAVAAAEANGATGARSKAEVIAAFDNEPATVWLMIPSQFVETELPDWLNALPAGSTLIDGGNSDYRLSRTRAALCADHSVEFIDVGTSGGVHGITNGFSMMVGGDETTVQSLAPVFTTLSAPRGGWRHVGPAGAGHYVKMVHNAIEYGMMQSLAEGYQLLKTGPYDSLDLVKISQVWEEGSIIASNLNDLTSQVLTANPTLDGIDGTVAESGEARWAIETAHASGFTLPAIEESFKVRLASQQGHISFGTKLLAAMRNAFGGHTINQR